MSSIHALLPLYDIYISVYVVRVCARDGLHVWCMDRICFYNDVYRVEDLFTLVTYMPYS